MDESEFSIPDSNDYGFFDSLVTNRASKVRCTLTSVSKTSIRYMKKPAPKINSDVFFTKFL